MSRFKIPNPTPITDFSRIYVMNYDKVSYIENNMMLSTFITDIKKFFVNPSECIQSVKYYPFDVMNAFKLIEANANVTFGDVVVKDNNDQVVSTWIVINNDFKRFKVRVGEITINRNELYGNYLDMENIYRLYLPYLETITLETEQVTPVTEQYVTIYVDYVFNIFTGSITAYVYKKDSDGNDIILHIVNGSVGMDIPLNTSSANDVARNLALGVTRFVASGGTGVSSLITDTTIHFNQIGGYSDGLAKMYGIQDVYLLIERPLKDEPNNYKELNGYPSNKEVTLGTLKGYAEIDSIKLDDVGSITNEEKKELENLLINGVFF